MEIPCFQEVVVSSADVPNKNPSIFVWDPKTGNYITTYKEGFVLSKGLCVVGQDYLACALRNTPIIKFNGLNKRNHFEHKFVVPGTVTALAVSPSGSYCVAGIGKNLFVWNIASGELDAILSCHTNNVTCLKFTDDGWYFVSAADATVAVWRLNEVLTQRRIGKDEPMNPLYRWSDHTSEVTDIFIGYGGHRARLVTVSSDYTCKVYDLSLGSLIFSVFGNISLSSVVMDASEYFLFLGSDRGDIFKMNWFSCLNEKSMDFVDSTATNVFRGHGKKVTCLSTSCDGFYLASGSTDGSVKLWNIETNICLVTVPHGAPVTNVFFMMASETFFSADKVQRNIVPQQFQKAQKPFEINPIEMRLKSCRPSAHYIEPCDEKFNNISAQGASLIGAQSKAELEQNLNEACHSNQQLYSFSMSNLLYTMKDYKVYYEQS